MTPQDGRSTTPHDQSQRERHAAIRRSARDQFDRWARTYDRSWLNELVFYPTIRICLAELTRWQQARGGGPFRLLDVGCGTGLLLRLLTRRADAARLVGLDYSSEMLRRLTAAAAELPGGERIVAVQGDAERLPFADASFDLITCCNSFHHYPHQAAAVADFHRVLRPGGRLILVDGFRDNVIGWVVFDVAVARVEGNVHHAAWSHVRRLIETAGFRRVEQRKVNVLAPLLVSVAQR